MPPEVAGSLKNQQQQRGKTLMLGEIGHFALILAACISITLTIVPLLGVQQRIASWIALARPAAFGQLFFADCLRHLNSRLY
jgi:hypothetical protein